MKTLLSLFTAALLLAAPTSSAQEPSSTRFLLIVDTSFSMNAKRPTTAAWIRTVVGTSFQDQIRAGEQFEVWTFNERADTTTFPILAWNPVESGRFAELAARRVLAAKHEKRTLYTPIISALQQLEGNSLVVLITDGDEKFTGTPFDAAINERFAADGVRLRQAKQPFMVTFQIENHRWRDLSILTEGQVLQLPEVSRPILPTPAPAEPESAPTVATAAAAEFVPTPPAVVIDLPPGARILPAPSVDFDPAPVAVPTFSSVPVEPEPIATATAAPTPASPAPNAPASQAIATTPTAPSTTAPAAAPPVVATLTVEQPKPSPAPAQPINVAAATLATAVAAKATPLAASSATAAAPPAVKAPAPAATAAPVAPAAVAQTAPTQKPSSASAPVSANSAANPPLAPKAAPALILPELPRTSKLLPAAMLLSSIGLLGVAGACVRAALRSRSSPASLISRSIAPR